VTTERWLLLSGGVGGAKLALGLDRVLPPGALTVIANTGDDFRHLGLHVSPDLDTLVYTLGGLVNPETGWGRDGETWQFMNAVAELGGPDWFRLGDLDLAVHVERTRRLAAGETLTAVTAALGERHGLRTRILPMSDAPAPTRVRTANALLDFQDYFVRQRAEPVVTGFDYGGGAATPAVLAACAAPGLAGILIAPSNPWLSIAPVLAVPGLAAALRTSAAPIVAVSPIIAGAALKGPTAKIMRELGVEVSATGIAHYYRGVADGLVLDSADAAEATPVEAAGLRARTAPTVMRTLEDRCALARATLDFARSLRP